jgi:hypothetical protein
MIETRGRASQYEIFPLIHVKVSPPPPVQDSFKISWVRGHSGLNGWQTLLSLGQIEDAHHDWSSGTLPQQPGFGTTHALSTERVLQ